MFMLGISHKFSMPNIAPDDLCPGSPVSDEVTGLAQAGYSTVVERVDEISWDIRVAR